MLQTNSIFHLRTVYFGGAGHGTLGIDVEIESGATGGGGGEPELPQSEEVEVVPLVK